jgi:hypothetical protein
MSDMSDPAVMWLMLVNFAMAAVVVVCCAIVAVGIARELLNRVRDPVPNAGTVDDHAFVLPELGLTMADGGEPEPRPGPNRKIRRVR